MYHTFHQSFHNHVTSPIHVVQISCWRMWKSFSGLPKKLQVMDRKHLILRIQASVVYCFIFLCIDIFLKKLNFEICNLQKFKHHLRTKNGCTIYKEDIVTEATF